MTVYLGTQGTVELQRQFGGEEVTDLKVATSDVDTSLRRFGITGLLHGQLMTGDYLTMTSTEGQNLDFVQNHTETSISKYIHVDAVDGIRLYDTFAKSINGSYGDAIDLADPSGDRKIKISVESDIRVIAQLSSFELNTERETVDTTTLSDDFRNRISTLISGSGRINAFWEYTGNTAEEVPNYILELILRAKVGSNFTGRFYLKTSGYNPAGHSDTANDVIWYNVDGVLTSTALQFSPNNVIQIAADFVTTGEIQLRTITNPPLRLLQEDGTLINLEQDSTAKLGLPDPV